MCLYHVLALASPGGRLPGPGAAAFARGALRVDVSTLHQVGKLAPRPRGWILGVWFLRNRRGRGEAGPDACGLGLEAFCLRRDTKHRLWPGPRVRWGCEPATPEAEPASPEAEAQPGAESGTSPEARAQPEPEPKASTEARQRRQRDLCSDLDPSPDSLYINEWIKKLQTLWKASRRTDGRPDGPDGPGDHLVSFDGPLPTGPLAASGASASDERASGATSAPRATQRPRRLAPIWPRGQTKHAPTQGAAAF